MLAYLVDNWWMLLIRGLCAIAFGILAFAWPGLTLLLLILFFAAHALVDGIAALVLGLKMRKTVDGAPWGAMIFLGVISVITGMIAFAWPGLTAMALLYLVAGWAIARGVFEIMAAIRLRKVVDDEWFLGLAGAASILLGILLIARPGLGLLSVVWVVATGAIIFGFFQVLLAFRLKGLKNRLPAAAS
jgi:uncharacterized membrane protein HdeD (DUF308 family)